MKQSSDTVVMVRPHHFTSNPETLADNTFQSVSQANDVAQKAYDEVTEAANTLRQQGVTVHLFEDETTQTPDSVFPNNWLTTHASGELVLYPMFSNNRRKERRADIIEFLQGHYNYSTTLDFSGLEQKEQFLEGTGAIVFDHQAKLAYAARSKRMHEAALNSLCERLGYEPVVFDASNSAGTPVYHTNVIMAVGTEFVMVALDMIEEKARQRVITAIQHSGKVLIELSETQIAQFAGNTLELDTKNGKLLALSTTAFEALTEEQKIHLAQWVKLVPMSVPTIELGGGSIRCMLAQVFKPT
ncbi:citrulline utilization hydrolase CtlX [Idiomarina sp.]|uniref:citrulline utilization hydrolase CtlX n=1 Tax=Idiomarina sp. TaxID=1874361 RepID=UPI0025C47D2D|nr:arginine deiminase-related protein [Idiomarina sp.]